jgi:hypothetical protein
MIRRATLIVFALHAALLGACESSGHASATGSDASAVMRDQGYALLYTTIAEECDVDKVLIIKRPAPQVAELIKAIGTFSRDTKGALTTLAKEEPSIVLEDQGLPKAELRTREAISSATSRQIVFSGGKELEFRLLLTQHEALNYIISLAGTIGSQDPRENRRRFLAQVVKEATALHERVLEELKTPYVGAAK